MYSIIQIAQRLHAGEKNTYRCLIHILELSSKTISVVASDTLDDVIKKSDSRSQSIRFSSSSQYHTWTAQIDKFNYFL